MQVQKCGKATTPNHTWNEGCHFAIDGDLSTLSLQVALIAKGMMSSKAVAFIKCPLRDIMVFYLARENGAIKTTEVALDLSDGNPNLKHVLLVPLFSRRRICRHHARIRKEQFEVVRYTHRVWQRAAQG